MCPAVHFVLFLKDFLTLHRSPHNPLAPSSVPGFKRPLRKKELSTMVTSEELDMTFRKVGNEFGFENVDAEFSAYRDLN